MVVNRILRVGALLMACAPASLPAQTIVIQAETILPVASLPIANGVIVVKDGKILSVGRTAAIPAGATVLKARTVMPGLIDAHCYLGCYREVSDPADALTSELRAVDAFDPTDPAIVRALRAGVTTAGIMPPNTNVIAGQAAVIRLARVPVVLRESAGLKLSISTESANPQRNPTSRAGIVDLLVQALGAARRGAAIAGTPQTRLLAGAIPSSFSLRVPPLNGFDSGRVPAFIHAPGPADVETALQFAAHARNPIISILHPLGAAALAARLKERKAAAVLGPLKFTDNDRTLAQAGLLARAGVPVAFCTDGPAADPASLRMTAHLAVRNGMGRESALRGLTLNAARILGIDRRTGSIAAGKDADLLILDGDPLDLTSRVVAVISGGQIAHRGEK